MNYDVAFYGDMRYEMMGNAFDRLTEENLSAEGMEKMLTRSLLRPNLNPLFPNSFFRKRGLKEHNWTENSVNEGHMTILIEPLCHKGNHATYWAWIR
jgi:hypothetical protein